MTMTPTIRASFVRLARPEGEMRDQMLLAAARRRFATPVPDAERIGSACEAVTGYTASDLTGRQRERQISYARHLLWHTLYHAGRVAITDITHQFGRDHSTVLEGIRRIRTEAKIRPETAADLARIRHLLAAQTEGGSGS